MPSEGVTPRNAKRAAPDASPDRCRNALRTEDSAPAPPSIGATSLGAAARHPCVRRLDLDGVLTDTAKLHAAAWKRMFDCFLEARARRTGSTFVPFDSALDYNRFVDGKQRADGVRSFLASQGSRSPIMDRPATTPSSTSAVSRTSWSSR